jgi:glycosyltransferase involved in cell wall biosynthesis
MTMRALNIFISHPSNVLTDSLPHGDGLIAHSILRRLADRGHTLHVAVPLLALDKPMPDNVHLYPIETRVPHTRDLQNLSYRVEYAVRVRRLFSGLCRRTKIDLIHQMNPVVGGLSLLLFGLGYPVLLGPIWPLLERYGGRARVASNLSERVKDSLLSPQFFRADGILSPTPASAARLPKTVQHSDRVIPFHMGIDVEQFTPGASAGPDNPTVLFLANLETRKGIFVLLSAFEQVLRTLPTAQLIIAGDGEQLNEVRRRIENSSHKENIHLVGRVARADVARTMRACSVYCLPSFREPYGMSALEAMA